MARKKKNTKSRARKRFEKQRTEYRLTRGDNIRSLANDVDISACSQYAEQNYGIKISEAVIQTAQTLLEKAETLDDQKHIMTLASFAWNYSSFDDEHRKISLDKLAQSFKGKEPDQVVDGYIKMVNFSQSRKRICSPR